MFVGSESMLASLLALRVALSHAFRVNVKTAGHPCRGEDRRCLVIDRKYTCELVSVGKSNYVLALKR